MWLILLWLGGLSFAGCIVWAGLFGFSTHVVLAMLATAALGFIGFKGLDVRRRLETLSNLGWAYFICGILAMGAKTIAPLSWWTVAFLACGGFALGMGCRLRLKQQGMLLDLSSTPFLNPEFVGQLCERYDSLSNQAEALRRIRLSGHKAVSGYTQYGPMYRDIGKISSEHQAQLPCVIRAKAGSISVYEIPAYMSWVARKGSLWRESYLNNPFGVPKRIKPTSHVQQALLRDLAELLASLKVTSKELKGRVIEVTPARTSVLLNKYELTPEELASVCQVLLRVEAMLDDYIKGDAVTK